MERAARKPISNFLIKRSLQTRITLKIIFIVIMTGIITSLILGLYYNYKSQEGQFYFMSNNVSQDLELSSILGVILPSLVTAQMVSFMLALGIGLFSSRKIAVPLYKIEKWASQLRVGNLNTRLVFREKEEMRDLTAECNGVVDFYKRIFDQIDSAVKQIDEDILNSPRVRENVERLKTTLGQVSYN